MLVWFAAASFLIVVLVFNSPAIDYRLVMLGAVAPVAEAPIGGPYVLHTLGGSVALFAIVVGVARGRRRRGRRLVALPIGTFLHLVLDGTWADGELFWWPLRGGEAFGRGPLPEFGRIGVSVALEAIGVAIAVWLVRRFELLQPARRELFVRRGQLARELLR